MSAEPNRPTDRPADRPPPTIAPLEPETATVLNPTEARQGAPANAVRYVLLFGLIGVIIAFLLAYLGTRP
jgi:hypothetical protein